MKRQVWFSIIIIVVILLGLWFVTQNNNSMSDTSKITLNYQSVKEFSPDIAKVVLGVETVEKDMKLALEKNNKKINQIKEALTEIPNIKISTANYWVRPEEEKQDDKIIRYHRVTNLLKINISELDKINKVVDKSLEAGANSVSRIEYDLKNRKQARDEVLNDALKGIEDKADFITEKLDNKKDNKIINLNINDNIGRNIVYETQAKTVREDMNPNIMPEKIKIEVNLRATYKVY